MCAHVDLYTPRTSRGMWRPKRADSTGTRVTSCWEPPDVGARNWAQVSPKAVSILSCWTIAPSPSFFLFKERIMFFVNESIHFLLKVIHGYLYKERKNDIDISQSARTFQCLWLICFHFFSKPRLSFVENIFVGLQHCWLWVMQRPTTWSYLLTQSTFIDWSEVFFQRELPGDQGLSVSCWLL